MFCLYASHDVWVTRTRAQLVNRLCWGRRPVIKHLPLGTRGMSRLFVEHCEAVAAKINITRRWLGEQ